MLVGQILKEGTLVPLLKNYKAILGLALMH